MDTHRLLQEWATGLAQEIDGYNVLKQGASGTTEYVLHDAHDRSLLRLGVNDATQQIQATIVGTHTTFAVHSPRELQDAVHTQIEYANFFTETSGGGGGGALPSQYPNGVQFVGSQFRVWQNFPKK